jgi:hypothetical protein
VEANRNSPTLRFAVMENRLLFLPRAAHGSTPSTLVMPVPLSKRSMFLKLSLRHSGCSLLSVTQDLWRWNISWMPA